MFALKVNELLALVKKVCLYASKPQFKTTKKSIIELVLDIREKLRFAISQANQHAKMSKRRSKVWYDRKAKLRSFEPGDEVLALLHVKGNLRLAKFSGPYKVLERLESVDYRVHTPGRRKIWRICYVNLLKPYIRRKDDRCPNLVSNNVKPVQFVLGSVQDSHHFVSSIHALNDLKGSNSSDIDLSHLSTRQHVDIRNILDAFSELFRELLHMLS